MGWERYGGSGWVNLFQSTKEINGGNKENCLLSTGCLLFCSGLNLLGWFCFRFLLSLRAKIVR